MADLPNNICVTGASGLIGRHICRKLHQMGYRTRVLTRSAHFRDIRSEVFTGDLCDFKSISKFLENTEIVFHCAAELHDESKMWQVNVKGTEMLLKASSQISIKYFCYLSSAGVVGKCKGNWVDEDSPCSPQNMYEKSKYVAEKLVKKGIPGCSTVILRPTNVIDDNRPGAIEYPIRSSFIDIVKVFVKGGEYAHIIHASDIADAAIFCMNLKFENPNCFFVSCDDDSMNTFAGIWSLYKAEVKKKPPNIKQIPHLPVIVPHILRKLLRGNTNNGHVRYSMAKLNAEGFKLSLGLPGAVKSVFEHNRGKYF